MAKQKRSDDWGFPRWRSYGEKGRAAAKLRLCDREGCSEIGDRPAPKAPHTKDRWHFCEAHAAEYNKNWNYFAGLSPEEAARRAAEEERGNSGFRQSAQWKWAGPGDGSRSRDEMRALDALELDSDADFKAVKAAHRRLVKETHPDANPGNEETAKRFKQVQAAYDVLKKAEERKNGKAGRFNLPLSPCRAVRRGVESARRSKRRRFLVRPPGVDRARCRNCRPRPA